MADRREILRHLVLGDDAYLEARLAERRAATGAGEVDYEGEALLKLGVLAATDGSDLTWQQTIGAALAAGLTPDAIVDALLVLAPVIGRNRVVAITPKIAVAMGYDVEAALESFA